MAIDLTLSISQPELASKLLRFYWFRWFDVVVPLAWTTVLWAWISRAGCATEIQSNGSLGPQLLSSCAAIACIGLAALIVVPRLTSNVVPRADNLVVQPVGKYQPDTDRHRDWLAVCAWIESNTPQDSLWMTPKHQQTFKWYAGRAEVVCWKDVPQDNASIIEWYRRVERMQPPRDRIGDVRGWTTEELKQLAAEYGFEWILVDRSIQTTIPMLELAYPIDIENKSFAVFRIRK